MKFYLGTHMYTWLYSEVDMPLFVSRRSLNKSKTWKPATTSWALDSGGFTELNKNGQWRTTPEKYVSDVKNYQKYIGRLDWAATQDWMCEPFVLNKTGLSVREHQNRTIQSYLDLNEMYDGIYWLPVIQGWELGDYLECIDMYSDVGVDLTTLPIVGLGSVCRRQKTDEIKNIIQTLASTGIKLHGFGVKLTGLEKAHDFLESADSMAWSFDARYLGRNLPGCEGAHAHCGNCPEYARYWYSRVMGIIRKNNKELFDDLR